MIDQYPPSNGVLTSLIWRKTAAGGETSLSGYDNASQALSYTPGQEQVYLNGILLVRGSDYTATNGTSITGLAALAADDFVQVNCYNNFSVASLPSTSITGEITNSQITSLATSKLTGTITNAQLAGSISNDKLSNSSITINGSSVSLGGSTSIDLSGKTDKSTLTTTGDIYYASSANTPARLGIGTTGQVLTVAGGIPSWATTASTQTAVGASAYKSGEQTLSNATFTAVTFNTEWFDTDGFHDNSTNTSRFTIPSGKGGKYLITGTVDFFANGTGRRLARLRKNGTTSIAESEAPPSGNGDTSITLSCTVALDLVATDYIELTAYQASGGNLNLFAGEAGSHMSVIYLGA